MADEQKKPTETPRAPVAVATDHFIHVKAGQGASDTSTNIKKASEEVARLKGKEDA